MAKVKQQQRNEEKKLKGDLQTIDEEEIEVIECPGHEAELQKRLINRRRF